MEFQLLGIFSLLSVAVVACHAALSPQAYWKSVLPNTPMPGAVKDSLSTAEWVENKGTAVGVGKGGVIVGGNYHGKPVYVGVTPSGDPFNYIYAASEDQLHDDPNVALFFKKNDLQKGNEMNMHFTKTSNAAATFLPRSAAGKIPFSTVKLPQILSRFSLSPDSKEAEVIKKTLTECEAPAMKGEEKFCATSLESMVDFSISQLGKNVKAISTEGGRKTQVQKYTISGSKNMGKDDDKAVVCHKQNYAYAVFYCHKTQTTEVYEVSLVGADGTKVKAVAVCHKDTSTWNPKHLAFQVLKVKPGTVPVCHFLPEDHVVWVN